jgi:hypothetical protein
MQRGASVRGCVLQSITCRRMKKRTFIYKCCIQDKPKQVTRKSGLSTNKHHVLLTIWQGMHALHVLRRRRTQAGSMRQVAAQHVETQKLEAHYFEHEMSSRTR